MRTFVSAVSVGELAWVESTVGNIIDELKKVSFGGLKFDDYQENLRFEFLYYPKRQQPGKAMIGIFFPTREADCHIILSNIVKLNPSRINNAPIIDGASFADSSELVVQRLRPTLSLWKNYRHIFRTSKTQKQPEEVQIEIWEFQIPN